MSHREVNSWSRQQFGGAELKDRRRVQRAVTVASAMAKHPGASVPRLFGRPYDVKAAYNLFKSEDATPENLQAGHRRQVLEALSRPGVYLLLEDTSEFAWGADFEIEGLGPVGPGDKQGFLLHTVLAVKWSRQMADERAERHPPVTVLGVADQQFHVRTPIPPGERDDDSWRRKLRERESQLWSDAGSHLGAAPAQAKWLRVCDRGADIYEFLVDCQKRGHGFVVRASQDRSLESVKTRLFEHARALPPLGYFEMQLRKRPQHPARVAKMAVSASPVVLKSPRRPGSVPGRLPGVPTWVIRAFELEVPAGVEPLEWILLTSDPAEDFIQARVTTLRYATRWVIEDYHKSLKTGLGANDLQLETAHRLFAAISIMGVVALRLLDLRERVRISPTAPAEESGLTPLELMLLSQHLSRKLKTVADVALAIGRLGGHMNRRADGMPGLLTLWRGMLELEAMAAGAAIAMAFYRFG